MLGSGSATGRAMELKYRPEIEGLRAVAVLAVVLFHLDVQGFGGGFVGVDVFFVISGFLITRQVRQMIETGTFTFSNFYVRRIRRLAPAFIFTATLAFIAAILLFSPDDLRRFATGGKFGQKPVNEEMLSVCQTNQIRRVVASAHRPRLNVVDLGIALRNFAVLSPINDAIVPMSVFRHVNASPTAGAVFTSGQSRGDDRSLTGGIEPDAKPSRITRM